MKVYVASDHAGFELKQQLLNVVRSLGYEVVDCGAYKLEASDDYPLLIASAARKLSEDTKKGIESRAVVIGASGQGEAMAANRFKGVRCAVYYGEAGEQTDADGTRLDIVASSRAHNDANALSIGARFVSAEEAAKALERWLRHSSSKEERHVRRAAQLDTLG